MVRVSESILGIIQIWPGIAITIYWPQKLYHRFKKVTPTKTQRKLQGSQGPQLSFCKRGGKKKGSFVQEEGVFLGNFEDSV